MKPHLGAIVIYMHGPEPLAALITDPAFMVYTTEAMEEQRTTQALWVFTVFGEHFQVTADFDPEKKPGTWHWPNS